MYTNFPEKNLNGGGSGAIQYYMPAVPVTYAAHTDSVNVSSSRKSKIFVKSRFSRNRQWCRPIVIWSLWMNILFMGFTIAVFYGFKFKVGYMPNLLLAALSLVVLSNLVALGGILNRLSIISSKFGKIKKLFGA